MINHNDIDIEAANILKTTGRVEGFKKAIRKVNKRRKSQGQEPISKEKQKELAEIIKDTPATGKTGGGNYYKSMENTILQEVDGTDEYDTAINEIYFNLDGIATDSLRLADKISNLNGKLHKMGVEELKTFSSLTLINNFSQLLTNLNILTNTLGLQFNKLNK